MLTLLTGAFGAVGKLKYLITLGLFSITTYLDRNAFERPAT